MRLALALLLSILTLPFDLALAAEKPEVAAAIAKIEALGGTVERDEDQPDRAVVAVDLIGNDRLKDEDLAFLKPLTSLRQLFLGRTATSDAGLKHVAGLKNLTFLGLIGTKVTDAGLKELAGLQKLESLFLADTEITDAGLKDLAKLKNLTNVLLDGTKATEAGVQELKKALPKAAIERETGAQGGGGGGGGQRTDPNFDVSVAVSAYKEKHPSVLFDEAHHNFHTAGGRYKVFADLVTNDGYRVTPNKEPFTPERLAKCDVLVIANALGGEWTANGGAEKPAFTKTEADSVQKWVEAGGSLLLITDHEPFGSAAEDLGKRFGVEMGKLTTVDPANESARGLLFAREKGQLADHPIMKGREASEQVNRVLTFTGQSLKGPPGSVALLKFADTAKDMGRGQGISAAGRAQARLRQSLFATTFPVTPCGTPRRRWHYTVGVFAIRP